METTATRVPPLSVIRDTRDRNTAPLCRVWVPTIRSLIQAARVAARNGQQDQLDPIREQFTAIVGNRDDILPYIVGQKQGMGSRSAAIEIIAKGTGRSENTVERCSRPLRKKVHTEMSGISDLAAREPIRNGVDILRTSKRLFVWGKSFSENASAAEEMAVRITRSYERVKMLRGFVGFINNDFLEPQGLIGETYIPFPEDFSDFLDRARSSPGKRHVLVLHQKDIWISKSMKGKCAGFIDLLGPSEDALVLPTGRIFHLPLNLSLIATVVITNPVTYSNLGYWLSRNFAHCSVDGAEL